MRRTQWIAALAGLQVLDLATTAWAINRGADESNPVVLFLGFPLAAAFKLGLVVLIIRGAHKWAPRFDHALHFAVVLYVAVCLLNLSAGYSAGVA